MTRVLAMQQTSPGNLWWVGLQTIVGTVIATLVVRAAAMAVLDIPATFPPLAASGPTVFLTVVGVLGGVGVFAAVCRWASQPIRLFRIIVAVALLVFVPDILLLTSDAFPGTTVTSVSTLMFQHVVAAAIVAWMLTMKGRRGRAAA